MPASGSSSTITVSPVTTTTYVVTGLDANNCSNTASVTVVVDVCTGIQNTGSGNIGITLYPNPNKGEFFLSLSTIKGSEEVELYSAVGQLVMTQKLTQAENTRVDMKDQANGVYLVRIKDGNTLLKQARLIKE